MTAVDSIYRVLLFTALVLLIILLYNNFILYKRKINEYLSLMILSAVIMCGFELVWEYADGHHNLVPLTYIGACGYAIFFVVFGTTFNAFFLNQFDLFPKKKWQETILYVIPNVVFFLLCVTTPWTRLVFWVDENAILQEMILFRALFYVLLMAYLLASLIPALYYAFFGRKKNPRAFSVAREMIVFGILGPGFFLLQILVLGDAAGDYLALSLSLAIALIYLITVVNTHLLVETRTKIEAVESELRIAAKIQTDALPSVAPEFADHLELNLRASMNTAKEVGGDFYDYFKIDSHRLCLLIADVSGKGTPAALFMMTVKTIIKDYALTHDSTSEIFNMVNQRLCENNEAGMFATAWIGILDTDTMILQYTNAGHNYPLFKPKGENCRLLKEVHGVFLAGFDDTIYKQNELKLNKGDRLLLYTDGVTEAHDTANGLYGTDRLAKVINNSAEESGERVLESILSDVDGFSKGEPQFDDITMMVLTIRE